MAAWVAWGLPAVVVVSWIVDLILIPRRVRAMGWAEREDDVLWREGILFRSVHAVPYGRLQYVDVSDGPLLRRVGLQTLTLKTAAAGGDVTLEGVPRERAEELREVLMARGQARLAGLGARPPRPPPTTPAGSASTPPRPGCGVGPSCC